MNGKNKNILLKTLGFGLFLALFIFSTVNAQLNSVHSLYWNKSHHPRWTTSEVQRNTASEKVSTFQTFLISSEKRHQRHRPFPLETSLAHHQTAKHTAQQNEKRTKRQGRRELFKILRSLEFHIRNMVQTNGFQEERNIFQQRLATIFALIIPAHLLKDCLLSLAIDPPSTPQRLHSLQILRL